MALLEVSGVGKSFGGLRALNDVSFQVEQGQILGVLGPNGAGKSTLFATLTGFHPADAGQWSLAGAALRGRTPESICRLGMVRTFQIVQPFHGMTVLGNATVAAIHRSASQKEAERHARQALECTGLTTKADQPIGNLTLADKKALEMAKACASGARVVLLDEVMAGLRPAEVERVVATILRLRKDLGLTFLIVEHLMDAIMSLSDEILVLNFGQVLAKGTPGAIRRDPLVLEAYLGGVTHA